MELHLREICRSGAHERTPNVPFTLHRASIGFAYAPDKTLRRLVCWARGNRTAPASCHTRR